MSLFFGIVFGLGATTCACRFYLLKRNNWVYRQRTKLLERDLESYHRLPSYDDMLYRHPFTWDISKFLK